MSVNEKALYKSITVGDNSTNQPVTAKKYRGISTVDNKGNNFVKYEW